MNFLSIIKIAFRALARNKSRSALTMLGIIIGVAAVIAMVSIGQGAQASVQAQIESIGTNLLFVSAGAQNVGGVRSGTGDSGTNTLTVEDLDAIKREVPSVSMVTPTTVAATLPTAPAHTALVMGVSKPDLPHVEGEIVQVARLLQASAFLNEDSTRTRLSAWLGGLTPETPALALHIASHAVMGGSKASSRLKLWDNEDLTGSDLDDLRRSLRYVQLVVLSACRSAGQGNSDLALGLAGLAEKGARSVLGSLWNVDDASTEQLMVAFYSAWRRDPHAGVAQALALAQRALLRDFAHPYFWASFEVIGRWN